MNTTSQALVFAVACVVSAAAGTGLAMRVAQAETQVVKLERVVVVGKRADVQVPVVAQLPRVVIEGRRAESASEVQVAVAKPLRMNI